MSSLYLQFVSAFRGRLKCAGQAFRSPVIQIMSTPPYPFQQVRSELLEVEVCMRFEDSGDCLVCLQMFKICLFSPPQG